MAAEPNTVRHPTIRSISCSVFVGTSVDGFIARADGALDWLPAGGGEDHGYTDFVATGEDVVMGRGTFDTVLSFDHWPFDNPVIVLTTRSFSNDPPAGAHIEFMSGEPHVILDRLRQLRRTSLDIN